MLLSSAAVILAGPTVPELWASDPSYYIGGLALATSLDQLLFGILLLSVHLASPASAPSLWAALAPITAADDSSTPVGARVSQLPRAKFARSEPTRTAQRERVRPQGPTPADESSEVNVGTSSAPAPSRRLGCRRRTRTHHQLTMALLSSVGGLRLLSSTRQPCSHEVERSLDQTRSLEFYLLVPRRSATTTH